VLNERASASTPYIEWVKEGRKYDLGAMLITQQPGSIPADILSQGDNWFIFHLLSEGDLNNVRRANAHFSEDLLSSLLNEPIPGQGVFWSGVSDMKYPIPMRVLLFEELYQCQDKDNRKGQISTYASGLRKQFGAGPMLSPAAAPQRPAQEDREPTADEPDPFRSAQKHAIGVLAKDDAFVRGLEGGGLPYGAVVGILKGALPDTMNDRDTIAFRLVPTALDQLLGPQHQAWETEMRETKGGRRMRFVVRLPPH
jgi:hypothetical protein